MDRDSDVVVYTAWPVSWNGIWVGTLAALAVGLIIGFIGTAVGAHEASRYDAGGKAQVASDLREGDAVTVTYADRGGKVVAENVKVNAR